jgi:hypothetical protein
MGVGALTPLFEQAGKPLPINTPQDIALKQAQIQNLQSQGAAQQQQTQEQALKNQQLQQQMGEYNTIRNYVAQNGGDYSKALAPDSPLASQISPQTWLGLQKTLQDTQGTAATAAKSHADAELAEQQAQAAINKGTQDYQDHLATLAHSLLSTGAQPAAVLAALDTEKGLNPQHADSITKLQQSFMQNPQMIQQQLGQLFLQGSPTVQANLQEQDNKNAAAPGTVAETAARTNLTNAQTETANLNNQQKQKLSALPDSAWNSAVDAVAGGDNAAAMATKAQVQFYRAQGNFEKANEAIDNLAKLKGATREDITKQGALIPDEISKAIATEKALAPLRVTEAINAEVGKQAAEAKLSGDAFGGIINPSERNKAEAAYDKANQTYAQKIAASKQLQDYVVAAQSGNKAAPGLIPLSELRAVVNRVNRTELEQQGGGSTYDKVVGFLSSAKEGQPIPPEVIKAYSDLANVTQAAAKREYDYNLAAIKATHPKANPQPIDLTNVGTPAGAQGSGGISKYKAGDTRSVNGKTYVRDDKGNWTPQ